MLVVRAISKVVAPKGEAAIKLIVMGLRVIVGMKSLGSDGDGDHFLLLMMRLMGRALPGLMAPRLPLVSPLLHRTPPPQMP